MLAACVDHGCGGDVRVVEPPRYVVRSWATTIADYVAMSAERLAADAHGVAHRLDGAGRASGFLHDLDMGPAVFRHANVFARRGTIRVELADAVLAAATASGPAKFGRWLKGASASKS